MVWRCVRGVSVILIVALPLAVAGPARASESPPPVAPALNATVARPHLENPLSALPRQIELPKGATAQRLLASTELAVPEGLRLLVFAPHPDDETLAAGGLIQRVLASHGTVRVVFITNGDGYVDGVRAEMHRTKTSTGDFLAYGERRHREALQALTRLGVSATAAVFLGFPDDGIDDLWAGHWSERQPYKSPYTQSDRPPYKESLSRQVEYAGIDLEAEIGRIVSEFSPQWVLLPDPRDRHPDHCTTGVFVLDALRQLAKDRRGSPAPTQVLTYLVHAPDYPASPAWVKEIAGAGVGGSATAGRALASMRWSSLPLSSAELAEKRSALAAYQSQIQVMQPFLKQFERPFELFGRLDAAQIQMVPMEYAARFRHPK